MYSQTDLQICLIAGLLSLCLGGFCVFFLINKKFYKISPNIQRFVKIIIPPLLAIYLYCCYRFAAIGLKAGWIDQITRFRTLDIAIFGSLFAFLGGAVFGFLLSIIGTHNHDYDQGC